MAVLRFASREQAASDAFEDYAAMRRAEARQPMLCPDAVWRGQVSHAWDRFLAAFEALR